MSSLAQTAVAQTPASPGNQPLRLAIAGLNHGHVSGFIGNAKRRTNLVGVYDPDKNLLDSYAKRNNLAETILFTDLNKMLDTVKPEAVSTFTDTYGHVAVVEACAPRHITVMMEKPLAVSNKQADAIKKAADKYGINVIVNYETTWYGSHAEMYSTMHDRKAGGEIRRMVAMDGHQGPKEINVQPEFLAWLGDPVKNGAGALFDFGCYGANLMTWMMDNQRPLKVTAITQTEKPAIYPKVDDEATVLVEYPKAQGVIQGSWNWPFSRKDFEVYAEHGYAIATGGANLRVRLNEKQPEETHTPAALPPDERDSIAYLTAVVRGKFKPSGLSSLENNMIVIEILDAARESARTGKTIALASK